MSKSNPWPAEKREAQLRKIVGQLAGKHGAKNITRRMVAKEAECSEPLVSSYLGNIANIQSIAKREAKKLGLTPPTGKEEAAIGAKLRAHKPGDPRDTRKRSVKEVKAAKDKAPRAKKSATAAAGAARRTGIKTAATDASSQTVSAPATRPKPQSPNPPERKPTAPPERKTAARPPKLPPLAPPEPLL